MCTQFWTFASRIVQRGDGTQCGHSPVLLPLGFVCDNSGHARSLPPLVSPASAVEERTLDTFGMEGSIPVGYTSFSLSARERNIFISAKETEQAFFCENA